MESIGPVVLRIERLEEALRGIDERITALEERRPRPAAARRAAAPAVAEESGVFDIRLAGVAVLILGGAFLLRALTEGGTIPPIAGVAAGIAYGAFWIWTGDRAARRGEHGTAMFHVATASMIIFPLVWETTSRLHFISPEFGGVVAAAFGLALLALAARDDEQPIAWIGSVGAIVAAAAIIVSTGALPVLMAPAVVGAATTHVSLTRKWTFAAWPAALLSSTLALATLMATLLDHSAYSDATAVVLLLFFACSWSTPIVWRWVGGDHRVLLFDVTMLVQLLTIGVGGAALIALLRQAALPAVTVVCFLSAAFGFAVAHSKWTAASDAARVALGAVATWSLCLGLWVALPRYAAVGIAWAIAGLALVELGRRRSSFATILEGAILLTAAAVPGNVIGSAIAAMAAPNALALDHSVSALIVSAAALAAMTRIARESEMIPLRVTLLVVAVIGGFYGGTAAALALVPSTSPASAALLRTVVLSAIASLLAIAARTTGMREGARLARVVLVVAGIKLLVQDTPAGSAATLVGSFASYGGAMLVIAGSKRRDKTTGSTPKATPEATNVLSAQPPT